MGTKTPGLEALPELPPGVPPPGYSSIPFIVCSHKPGDLGEHFPGSVSCSGRLTEPEEWAREPPIYHRSITGGAEAQVTELVTGVCSSGVIVSGQAELEDTQLVSCFRGDKPHMFGDQEGQK